MDAQVPFPNAGPGERRGAYRYPVVPAYPASHGCVRQAFSVAHSTYDFAEIGMPVTVLAHS
ncbi:MAG: hypothetical protein ACXVRK_06725 [Gaiellaceae bacterium]